MTLRRNSSDPTGLLKRSDASQGWSGVQDAPHPVPTTFNGP